MGMGLVLGVVKMCRDYVVAVSAHLCEYTKTTALCTFNGEPHSRQILSQYSCYFKTSHQKIRSPTSEGQRTKEWTKPDPRAERYLVCDTAFQSNRGRKGPLHPRN